MLVRPRRRWANIKPALLFQRIVFVGPFAYTTKWPQRLYVLIFTFDLITEAKILIRINFEFVDAKSVSCVFWLLVNFIEIFY